MVMKPVKLSQTAKEMNPDVTVIVRAHYDDEVSFIKERGADHIIIGEHEIAKSMATHVQ